MSSTVIEPVLVMLEPTNRGELDATRNDLLATRLPDAITSPQEFAAIAADQERIDRFIKRAKPEFDDVCDSAHKAWKKACNLRALFFDGLEAFNARARRLLGEYRATEERLRRDEERRISEEQRRAEQERINREAKLLEKQGHKEMAAAVRQTPVCAPAVSLPSSVPVVQGLTFSTVWKWRFVGCTDANGGRKDKDARKRAASILPRDFLDPDDSAITARVSNMKSLAKIPGIEVYSEQVPVRR